MREDCVLLEFVYCNIIILYRVGRGASMLWGRAKSSSPASTQTSRLVRTLFLVIIQSDFKTSRYKTNGN